MRVYNLHYNELLLLEKLLTSMKNTLDAYIETELSESAYLCHMLERTTYGKLSILVLGEINKTLLKHKLLANYGSFGTVSSILAGKTNKYESRKDYCIRSNKYRLAFVTRLLKQVQSCIETRKPIPMKGISE